LDNPRIAAGSVREARTDLGEQLVHDVLRAQEGERLPAGSEVAAAAERDQLLGDRLDGLGLRLGRPDAAVLDQRAGKAGVQRLALGAVPAELLACAVMTHATRRLAAS